MKKIVDRTQDKVKLAREIGLHSWADIREIIAIKFKPITTMEVNKRLYEGKLLFGIKYYRFQGDHMFSGLFTVVFIFLGGQLFSTGISSNDINPFGLKISGILITLIFTLYIIRSCSARIRVDNMDFKEWKDDVPYGALCAVKEAQEIGFKHFEIYYPIAQDKRIFSDPIILGWKEKIKTNKMGYKIFYWDDGKIYE